MELQEKSAILVQEKLFYDAIPLIIFDKTREKNFKAEKEDLKYYVSNPFWMKFRLLLFWTLWAALIMSMIIIIFAHFWFIPRTHYSSNKHENINTTIVNTSFHKMHWNGTS